MRDKFIKLIRSIKISPNYQHETLLQFNEKKETKICLCKLQVELFRAPLDSFVSPASQRFD